MASKAPGRRRAGPRGADARRSSTIRAATVPSACNGAATVVSGGEQKSEPKMLSTPITLTSSGMRTPAVVTAVRDLGFEPEPSIDGKRLHRFVRTTDNQVIDILAPNHSPPGWKPTTVPPLQTIQIAGGNQALQRLVVITVTKGGRTSDVPVPSVLGSLILKAAAYQVDSRDRERHAADATFLVSLIT